MLEISKREKKKLLAEQTISEIALNLFLSKGLNETSVAEIMEKAGFATGTFYNYFESKEDIIKCTLAEKINMASKVCENIQLSEASSTQKLIQILQVVGDTYDKSRHLVELYLRYYHNPGTISKGPPHGERFIEVMSKIILEGQNKNEFRKDIPCEIIIEMFTGILKTTMSSDLKLTFIDNINYKYSILLEGVIKRD